MGYRERHRQEQRAYNVYTRSMIKRYMRHIVLCTDRRKCRVPRRLSRLPFFFIARHPQKWEGNEKERSIGRFPRVRRVHFVF